MANAEDTRLRGAPVDVRVAGAADAGVMTRLVNRAYEDEYWIFGEGTDRTSLAEIARGLADPGMFHLVAEARGRMVAAVRIEIEADGLYFGMLAVDPACQGRGIGAVMVRHIEEAARARGLPYVRLVCIKEKRLPEYYSRMGYMAKLEESNPGWGEKVPIHVVHMEKRVLPEVGG